MSDILKTNIFFFITAVAVMLVSAAIIVVLIYLIRILRDVKYISRTVREESDCVREDVVAFRASIREEGIQFKHFLHFVGAFLSRGMGGGRKRTKKTHTSDKISEA